MSVCVCSLRYPACNARAPYCHLWPAPLYNIFQRYLINGTIFEKKKKVIEHKMRVLISVGLLSQTFLIVRGIERDVIKICLHVKHPIFVPDFGETWIFLAGFRKILRCRISWKSFQEETSSMRIDGRADTTKLIAAFRTFAKSV